MHTIREFITDDELDEVIGLLHCPPHMMLICNSVRTYRTGRYPLLKIRVFGYPSTEPKLWFLHSEDSLGIVSVFIWSLPWHKLENDEFFDAFGQFTVIIPLPQEILAIVPSYLFDKFSIYIETKTSYTKAVHSMYMYYMDENQQQMVLREELQLPAGGYYYNEDKPEEDAPIINDTWRFARKGDYGSTMEKLRRLPNVVVRYQGQPVAYVMSDGAGLFNHQFVHEKHRGRGLGKLLERRLSQKIIRDGFWPCKTVEMKNDTVATWSDRSPFWTRYNDESGNPIIINFIALR